MKGFIKTLSISALTLALSGCLYRSEPPAPVVSLGKGLDSASGAVMVKDWDTLYDISLRFNIPLQDLILANDIQPPYTIAEGQRLKLPTPRQYTVKQRDNIYRISRMFGVSQTELTRTNALARPYNLRVGQILQIPSRHIRLDEVSYTTAAPVEPVEQHAEGRPVARPPVTRSAATRPTPRGAPSKTSSFVWPVRGNVISDFGPKGQGLHNDGMNIAAARGTEVGAAKSGTVVYTGSALEGFGNLVILRHANGWVTAYAHLDQVRVSRGQKLNAGDILGTVGSTGRVDQPQLHFEVRRGSEALNPKKFLS